MGDKYLIQVKNLQISWKLDKALIPIVCGLDFNLKAGKVLALVGESGCGKSVTSLALLQLLAKELEIVEGEILFNNEKGDAMVDIAKLNPRGKEIQKIRGGMASMIFQEPMSSFSPLYTIGQQIIEVIQLHKKKTKAEAEEITINLLRKVGLADPEKAVNRFPGEFSGGMRQRAMIAKALSCNPRLLIADEPTTALDVTIQAQILDLMNSVKDEFGTSIIFVSHDLGVVGHVADDVAIMYMGSIVEKGPVQELFNHPKHPYTMKLLDAIPRLGNLEKRKRLEPIRGSVPSLFSRPSGCAFHDRCDYFMTGVCDKTFPDLKNISQDQQVACYLYE
jgi:peptide/nickel transport system ATP-binding protein